MLDLDTVLYVDRVMVPAGLRDGREGEGGAEGQRYMYAEEVDDAVGGSSEASVSREEERRPAAREVPRRIPTTARQQSMPNSPSTQSGTGKPRRWAHAKKRNARSTVVFDRSDAP